VTESSALLGKPGTLIVGTDTFDRAEDIFSAAELIEERMSLLTFEVNPNNVEVNDADLLGRRSGGEEEISFAESCAAAILLGDATL